MNAQREWKSTYKAMKKQLPRGIPAKSAWRRELYRYRREAALERRLASAQRTIEAQAQRIAQLEGYIDQHNQRVLQQDIVNKFLFHNS